MNDKLLEKVKQRILEHPNRFVMRDWIVTPETNDSDTFTSDNGQKIPFDKCGTAACIAGWACLIQTKGEARMNTVSTADEAMDYLDLSEEDAEQLFYVGNWPSDLARAYGKASTQAERAQIAAQRIDRFIAEVTRD